MKNKTKKSLGQNFLRDKRILKKIAIFAQIKKEDTVVEVGPGEGTLTEILLERADKVIAIEKDEKLTELLTDKFKPEISSGKLEIINDDILNYELRIENYVLVGNIPYYITGALFKKFLESENQPSSLTFVVQKEVAERIVARDGKESILSISIKAYGMPEFGGVIKAGSFNPKPKIDSAIISVRGITPLAPLILRGENLTPNPSPPASPRLRRASRSRRGEKKNIEKKFFEILKAGFAHKRKLLIKNLGMSKTVFDICGIPEKTRAENLKVEDWICLTKELV